MFSTDDQVLQLKSAPFFLFFKEEFIPHLTRVRIVDNTLHENR